jgi:hypothetical protein
MTFTEISKSGGDFIVSKGFIRTGVCARSAGFACWKANRTLLRCDEPIH